MARGADFDLASELAKPSFTPAQRDAPALVELVMRGDDRAAVALATLGEVARRALELHLGESDDGARSRLVAALGLIARRGDPDARTRVIAMLGDASPRVRRAAISALAKLDVAGSEANAARAPLLARWDAGDVTADERHTLAEALGKLGGDDALARLRALDPGDDSELARRRDRALLMAERTGRRGEESEVRVEIPPPAPVAVRLGCKPGLAQLLGDELRTLSLDARGVGDHAVDFTLATPWSTLFASRLWQSAGIRVPRARGELAASITQALVAPATRALLAAWTRGPIRWRLDLPAGKQRAVVWRVARDVAAAAPELINDPTATTWDVVVDDAMLELRPRRVADPRFAYRVADVPAASHPTIAAALARVGEARPDDRVWDPFVGSAVELIERARLGPRRYLVGTDIAKSALAAAHANLDAAGVIATLECGDARAATGERDLDLVITNPPLGSRIHVDAATLLVEVLPVIARRLVPRGRLVWITPAPKRTTPVAERLGLSRVHASDVDLGGVRGRIERWDAPAR